MASETSDGSGVVAARRGEPARLVTEIAEVQGAIRALSLTNYAVHIANHKTERATREQLAAGGDTVARIEATASAAAARLDALQPQLTRLHGAHAKLRQTLLHHSAIVELLEAPSVMETCLRTGLLDEALDVAEYGTSLFFAHRLWMLPSATTPTSIVARVVADIHVVADDLRESILHQLAGRLTLPHALRLLGHLRRLYSQQALARKRAIDLRQQVQQRQLERHAGHESGGGGAERVTPSAAMFSLSAEEDCKIVEALRTEFLACRDLWHRQEIDAIPRHNAHQYLLRVVDLQRAQWADIATQFLAVCHTIRPQQQLHLPGADSGEPSKPTAPLKDEATRDHASGSGTPAPPNAALAEWLQGRVTWFVRALAGALPSIDDGAHIAFILQQCTYAARRAGRLGADYSHILAPIFHAHIRSVAAGRSADAASRVTAALASWQWAHRPAYDDLPAAAPKLDAVSAADPAASALAFLQPPSALMAFPPLAELANAAVAGYNALRPCTPVDAREWILGDCVLVMQALALALRDALHSPYCPLVSHAAQGRGVGAALGGRAPPATPMPQLEGAAVRRFAALVRAAGSIAGPFLARVASHQSGGRFTAAGFEEPATSTPPPLPAVLQEAVASLFAACEAVGAELAAASSRQGFDLSV